MAYAAVASLLQTLDYLLKFPCFILEIKSIQIRENLIAFQEFSRLSSRLFQASGGTESLESVAEDCIGQHDLSVTERKLSFNNQRPNSISHVKVTSVGFLQRIGKIFQEMKDMDRDLKKILGVGVRDGSEEALFRSLIHDFGRGSNMTAEALSLLVGLSICAKFQVKKVAIRCDSKALIDIVSTQAGAPWHIQPIIRKISRYKYLTSNFSHCYREGNCVADSLAKEAQSHRETKLYTSLSQISNQVRALVQMDSWNICNFRFSKNLCCN